MQINAMLSGYLSPLTGIAGNSAQVPAPAEQKFGNNVSAPVDAFSQGEWWKNQSGPRVISQQESVKTCNCRQCPACASRVYQQQERVVSAGNSSQESVLAKRDAAERESASGEVSAEGAGTTQKDQTGEEKLSETGPKGPDGRSLTQAEQLQIAKLKKIDTDVRAHELAHLAAAGPYAKGGATFQYQRGPDGQSYAVGGEVQIDTSRESSPEATISKMKTVRAAALAPADPSPQDRKVAAQASVVMTEAVQQLRIIRLEQAKPGSESAVSGASKNAGVAENIPGEDTEPKANRDVVGSGYDRNGKPFVRPMVSGVIQTAREGASSSVRITV